MKITLIGSGSWGTAIAGQQRLMATTSSCGHIAKNALGASTSKGSILVTSLITNFPKR